MQEEEPVDGDFILKWATKYATKLVKGKGIYLDMDTSEVVGKIIERVMKLEGVPNKWNRRYIYTVIKMYPITILRDEIVKSKVRKKPKVNTLIRDSLYSPKDVNDEQDGYGEIFDVLFSRLDDDLKETMLDCVKGKTIESIAKERGITLATVKSRKIRAYEKIRRRFCGSQFYKDEISEILSQNSL